MRNASGPTSKKNLRAYHDEVVRDVIVGVCATRLAIVWEQPTGMAFREGQPIRYGLPGCADITGIICGLGLRLEIEIKTGRAVQQQNQKDFEAMVIKNNGVYFVARSKEDAITKLSNAIKIIKTKQSNQEEK